MIDLKALEKNSIDPITQEGYLDGYRKSLASRGGDLTQIEALINLNIERKKLITSAETKKAEQNKVSQEIGLRKKKGEAVDDIMSAMGRLRDEIKSVESEAEAIDLKVVDLAARLPNRLHPSTPVGTSESDNKLIRMVGEKPQFKFETKQHFEIGESLGVLDFDRASKVTGARFAFLKNGLARLERALINFMMDLQARENGYSEIIPPYMVNADSLYGTGQFPKFKEDVFQVEPFTYYLAPTAEVPVTNYFRDEILDEEMLPSRFVAFSPCFRSEAGSHGRDTRGLIRQHQFHKVELMTFSHPDKSYEELERLVSNAEEVLKRLDLHYRVIGLCSADIGFGSAKTYDLEVWLPGQQAYREISSCSNCEDFQARRAQIRFKSKGGKPQFVHTLNGSGLAVGRTAVAVLENYQQEDGRVKIPKVLKPYFHGDEYL